MTTQQIESRLVRFKPLDEFDANWIKDKIDEEFLNYTELFGLYLCDKRKAEGRAGRNSLTNAQFRNFFSEVRRIQFKIGTDKDSWDRNKADFLLLRPKLAYAEARVLSSKRGPEKDKARIKDFRKVLEAAHSAVHDFQSFNNFLDFMEAIIAYHKAYGGKDS